MANVGDRETLHRDQGGGLDLWARSAREEREAQTAQRAAITNILLFTVIPLVGLITDPRPWREPVSIVRLSQIAWEVVALVVLVSLSPRPRRRVCEVIGALAALPQIFLVWFTGDMKESVGRSWEPFLRQKLIFLLLGLAMPPNLRIGIAVLSVFAFEVCLEYWVGGLRSSPHMTLGEPWITLAIAVVGLVLLVRRQRHLRSDDEVSERLRWAVAARDQVLGFVAHDLRNPLSTIILQSSALERRGPEPERRNLQIKDTLLRAAARMNHMIQDLLDVAVVQTAALKISPERTRPDELMLEVVELQRPLAASSGIELRFELDRDAAEVWADRNRLSQVFENLIGNAVKFTEPGGCITIAARSHGDAVLFSVTDTGAGISEEDLAHVFDRFWELRKKAGKGPGLGLQIVKGIVHAHHGRIWSESELGEGTTFYFTIPLAPATEAQPGQAELNLPI